MTGWIGLGFLPGDNGSVAFAASADGSLIVGGSDGSESRAFVWDDEHGMRRLSDLLIAQGDDLLGWRLVAASGVSADGRTIVGVGIDPTNRVLPWLARLEPAQVVEPGTFALFGISLLLLLGHRRAQRKRVVDVTFHSECLTLAT
jgi:hypothetical protein